MQNKVYKQKKAVLLNIELDKPPSHVFTDDRQADRWMVDAETDKEVDMQQLQS